MTSTPQLNAERQSVHFRLRESPFFTIQIFKKQPTLQLSLCPAYHKVFIGKLANTINPPPRYRQLESFSFLPNGFDLQTKSQIQGLLSTCTDHKLWNLAGQRSCPGRMNGDPWDQKSRYSIPSPLSKVIFRRKATTHGCCKPITCTTRIRTI